MIQLNDEQKKAIEILENSFKKYYHDYAMNTTNAGNIIITMDNVTSAIIREFQKVQDRTHFNYNLFPDPQINRIKIVFYNRNKLN